MSLYEANIVGAGIWSVVFVEVSWKQQKLWTGILLADSFERKVFEVSG